MSGEHAAPSADCSGPAVVPSLSGFGGRNGDVMSTVTGRAYLAPREYYGTSMMDDHGLYARAPWMDRKCLGDRATIARYEGQRGELPGGLPAGAVATRVWRDVFTMAPDTVRIAPRGTLAEGREEHVVAVVHGLERYLTWESIGAGIDTDQFVYRTYGEQQYDHKL